MQDGLSIKFPFGLIMKSPNEHYEVIKTQDGSYTLFSKAYNEACHSLAGAREETKLHYLQACQVAEKLQTLNKVRILEIGFGTGIGFQETYKLYKELAPCAQLEFYSLEIDPQLADFFYQHNPHCPELKIIIGNGRQTIKNLAGSFDCIYQDAFSPKRNPELWTRQWFHDLGAISHDQTILSTYSASTSIRKSLLAAGWHLYNGASFGTKKSSTIAKRSGKSQEEIIVKLNQSSVMALEDDDATL